MTGTTTQHFEPGAQWAFVHSSGKRTEYVFERQMAAGAPSPDPKVPGFTPLHALRNPVTDKLAMVSEKWMCEGPINNGSHWVAEAVAPPVVVA